MAQCLATWWNTFSALPCLQLAAGVLLQFSAMFSSRWHAGGVGTCWLHTSTSFTVCCRCLFNVADMHKLNLGNEGYTLTKMCRRISRSMSAHGPAVSDPLGVVAVATAALSGSGAAAVLGPAGLPLLALSSCGTNTPKAAAALQSVADAQADWANASYEPMSDSEAAQMMSAAEAGATAMLNLKNSGASEGVMLHAKRLSGGGGSMKLVCNLKAIKEETDKPVHVIETETAVTEVYGDGLTIIRSAQSCRKVRCWFCAWGKQQVPEVQGTHLICKIVRAGVCSRTVRVCHPGVFACAVVAWINSSTYVSQRVCACTGCKAIGHSWQRFHSVVAIAMHALRRITALALTQQACTPVPTATAPAPAAAAALPVVHPHYSCQCHVQPLQRSR